MKEPHSILLLISECSVFNCKASELSKHTLVVSLVKKHMMLKTKISIRFCCCLELYTTCSANIAKPMMGWMDKLQK